MSKKSKSTPSKLSKAEQVKIMRRFNERVRYFTSLTNEEYDFIKVNVRYPDGAHVSSTDWKAFKQAEFIRKYREHIQTQTQNAEVLQEENANSTDHAPTGE